MADNFNIHPGFLARLSLRGYRPIGDECAKGDADLITTTANLERDAKDTTMYLIVEDSIRPGVFVPCVIEYASV